MKKNCILFSYFLIILVLLLLFAGCKHDSPPSSTNPFPGPLPSTGTTEGLSEYNSKYGFSFNYCSSEFQISEDYKGVNVALLGPTLWDYYHRINIPIIIGEFPKNKSLDSLMKDNIEKGEKELKDFTVVEEYSTTIGGLPAEGVLFTFKQKVGEEIAEYKDIFLVLKKDDAVYMIKYDVPTEFYDEYINCFNIMMSSFKFN